MRITFLDLSIASSFYDTSFTLVTNLHFFFFFLSVEEEEIVILVIILGACRHVFLIGSNL